jgi:hypothetical protein
VPTCTGTVALSLRHGARGLQIAVVVAESVSKLGAQCGKNACVLTPGSWQYW